MESVQHVTEELMGVQLLVATESGNNLPDGLQQIVGGYTCILFITLKLTIYSLKKAAKKIIECYLFESNHNFLEFFSHYNTI